MRATRVERGGKYVQGGNLCVLQSEQGQLGRTVEQSKPHPSPQLPIDVGDLCLNTSRVVAPLPFIERAVNISPCSPAGGVGDREKSIAERQLDVSQSHLHNPSQRTGVTEGTHGRRRDDGGSTAGTVAS